MQVPGIPVGSADSDHTDELHDTKDDLSGFDTAREEPVAKHPGTAMAQISTQTSSQKPSRYPAAKQHDPSIRFVKELPKHPEYRYVWVGHEDSWLCQPGPSFHFICDVLVLFLLHD